MSSVETVQLKMQDLFTSLIIELTAFLLVLVYGRTVGASTRCRR